jgi:uncharacterized protein YbaP (TraB family)
MQLYPSATTHFHMKLSIKTLVIIIVICTSIPALAQPNAQKYQGLLWEISGNGLKKPSFLFGTMHVSSKLAFHLSDSFYYALRQVDAVALELNPDLWQAQMVRLSKLNENFNEFTEYGADQYLTESSFKIKPYEDGLKAALSTEPPVVNSLLYRSYKMKEDFEEDTFLDLYIFQAGRKLGKKPAGVEDYYESEKLVMEAYRDMANEKKKKDIDLDGETVYSLVQKLQQAYRNGDLDLMDSLDNKMEKSAAFREKFLYRRNDIQADAIDSIVQRQSLFVGVGAAHLPGSRGVIESLRKKGYTLRAVKMLDRDASQKEVINAMKVPVNFSLQEAEDNAFTVQVPGPLYSLKNNYQQLNRVQYADMSNGSYYMVTRVKTYASFVHESVQDVAKKTDSLLYEYIPGDIISKKDIERNGYHGLDIVNRTRRGDMQRYQIYYTPFEVFIFKMSGKGNYVDGEEAGKFFNSIKLKEYPAGNIVYNAGPNGFKVKLPHQPHEYYNQASNQRWEYEAVDKTSGDAFLLMTSAVHNYDFLESDSFDLALIETSFRSAAIFDKQISRQYIKVDGYPALQVKEKLKGGDYIHATYILKGPHYYVIARRSKTAADPASGYLKSFAFAPYRYPDTKLYVDSFFKMTLSTPVYPEIDNGIRMIIEQTLEDAANGNNGAGYYSYWKTARNAMFADKKSGNLVSVQMQEYPKYYSIYDSLRFWKDDIASYLGVRGMMIEKVDYGTRENGKALVLTAVIADTGSSRRIDKMLLQKGRYVFTLSSMSDSIAKQNQLAETIFKSFQSTAEAENIYQSKLHLFFADLFSEDSATHKRAQQSISNIHFSYKDANALYNTIQRLSIKDKDYFDSKTRLIAEYGYIKDSITDDLPRFLKKVYEQTADTSMFQNEAMIALARIKTKTSYDILKNLMLQDPPIFESSSSFSSFFAHFYDSLSLSAIMFPQMLQLATLSDYKENINSLLVTLVDSGYVKAADYEPWFAGIYIDAKVAMRKQQAKDEKKLEEELQKLLEPDEDAERDYAGRADQYSLGEYAVLLMPFYESNKNVPVFFTRLLRSSDDLLRLNTAVLMLRNKKPVPDSIFAQLAASDKYRAVLYSRLSDAKLLQYFPKTYATQLALTRSFLHRQNEYDKMDSLVFLKKMKTQVRSELGYVYFYKYRIKKTDEWKIAFSGLQPLDEKKLNDEDRLSTLTEKNLSKDSSQDEQLIKELQKVVFRFYDSGVEFFESDEVSAFNFRNFED